jgi:enoyl-CoA hydratase/carnithine racemase
VNLVGPAAAKDILFSARRLDAEEALRLGLVSRVVAPEALEDEVRAYAATLAEKAPLSLRASKAIVNELTKPESAQDPGVVRAHVEACFNSADYTEGRRAFMEKRTPVFQGR